MSPPEKRDDFVVDLSDLMNNMQFSGAAVKWEIYLRGSNSIALELVVTTSDASLAERITDDTVASVLETYGVAGKSPGQRGVKRGSNKLAPA
ncbi:hypothetical protein [Brevibacterium oceani]|uniref:hypothetical protein n=1 Tax=Brevibacterium oceani TaxID=358099 RepID=UPI0015E73F9B|nr:hypothetical protein [Brevibacterium oceani]